MRKGYFDSLNIVEFYSSLSKEAWRLLILLCKEGTILEKNEIRIHHGNALEPYIIAYKILYGEKIDYLKVAKELVESGIIEEKRYESRRFEETYYSLTEMGKKLLKERYGDILFFENFEKLKELIKSSFYWETESQMREEFLIPFLKNLGWDTRKELYRIDTALPDFVLKSPKGKFAIGIEAKRGRKKGGRIEDAEEVLKDPNWTKYLNSHLWAPLGMKILILTDGSEWKLFYWDESIPFEQRKFLEINFYSTDTEEKVERDLGVLIKFLKKENVENGITLTEAEKIARQNQG